MGQEKDVTRTGEGPRGSASRDHRLKVQRPWEASCSGGEDGDDLEFFQADAVQVTPRLYFETSSPFSLDLPGIVNISPVCVDALADLSALQGYLARELVSCQAADFSAPCQKMG